MSERSADALQSVVTIRPLLLSRKQTAAALGSISVSHLDRLERRGAIGPRPLKLGKCVLYRVDELRAWVEAGLPGRVAWDNERREGHQQEGRSSRSGRDLRRTG